MANIARLLSPITFFAVLLLSACGGTDPQKAAVEVLIGPNGGTVASADGLMMLSVPSGALTTSATISVRRVDPGASAGLLLYEMLPKGLQFQSPATMSVNITSLLGNSSLANLKLNQLPIIVTTNAAGNGLDGLDAMSLSVDADAGTASLSGQLRHFSRFAVGGDLGAKVGIEGVPEFWPANTSFGPVQVVLEVGANTTTGPGRERLSFATYFDSSDSPVVFGEANPFQLTQLPVANSNKTYSLKYACGNPGVGTYRVRLLFFSERYESYWVTTPEEVNIVSAFLLGAAGPLLEGGETRLRYLPTSEDYTFNGTRKVNCNGSQPGTGGGTGGGGDTTGGGGTTGGGSDSTGGGGGTPVPAVPPVIATTSQIAIQHTFGQTTCPTPGNAFTITTTSQNNLLITVSEALDYLTVSPGSVTTAGGSAQFTPSFPCSGYKFGENTGVVSVTAQDLLTGLTSNTLQIPVVVTVNQ